MKTNRRKALTTMETIETVEYEGFTINVYPDYDCDIYDLVGDCNGAIHCDARDLYLNGDGRRDSKPITLANTSVAKMLEIMEKNHVAFGGFGSHSGVWLTGYEVQDAESLKALAKEAIAERMEDYDETEEEAMEELSCYEAGLEDQVILIIPKDADGGAYGNSDVADVIKSCWDTWNMAIQGGACGYTVTDKDGDDTEDSCWGFLDAKDAIEQAKEAIDAIEPKEYYTAKYAE